MIRNLIVYINSDRSVFPKELKIANQFEIKTNEIKFIFDGDIPRTGYPYLILTNRNGSFYLPLVDDSVVFGSQETWIMGGWSAHIMISQAEIINGIVNKSEKLFISDDFGLWVEPSDINIDDLKEQQIPTPLKLLYDDLFALKERVEEILDGGLSDGKDGVDGVSPTVSVSKSGKVTTITINDVEGTKTATINDGLDGKDGSNGQNGKDGTSVTVSNVSESTADGGSNVVRFSDGKSITIKNGSKGSKGDSGQDGADGHTPVKGVDYFDGQNGKDGQDGKDGVSISSVTQITTSSEDGGTNIVQVTLSNGNKSSFQVKNGSKGSKGDKGDTGPTGPAYTLTASDKAAITASVKSEIDPELDELKESITDLESGTVSVPDYWIDELETKVNAIQVAMEQAGRKKSAFLWYTDSHWVNGNTKVSPLLLRYLYENTPMNKVNFGGDIIGDTLLATRDEMTYLYEWRKMIKELPNHHSVLGNHDMFSSDSVDYEDDNYRYAFMIAPEESSDMVMGDGNYYYIDNRAEKTRYLYLCYPNTDVNWLLAHSQFIADAIMGVDDGWHIVAIAHRWWQYSSSSTPTTGGMGAFEADILSVFDAYNARETRNGSNYFYAQDFTNAKGKVEFCVGGHIHVDYDTFSNGGIPVIITTSDTNQNRVPSSTVDSGTVGTITESAVFGIIADYNEEVTKITVVGVGRGTSRVVRASTVTPKSISNISYTGDTTIESVIDKSKFTFTVNYSDGSTSAVTGASTVTPATIGVVGNNSVTITYVENGVTLTGTTTIVGTPKPIVNLFDKNDADVVDNARFNSSNVVKTDQTAQLVTGYFEAKVGDTFTVKTDRSLKSGTYSCDAMMYNSGKSAIDNLIKETTVWSFSSDNLTGTFTIPSTYGTVSFTDTAYVRFSVAYTNKDNIVITKS